VSARPNRGTVLAKGRGRRGKKGVLRPLDVNVGDQVLFPDFAGTKIQIDGEEFLILREEDLLGIATN
jgi:chaperonin GroES